MFSCSHLPIGIVDIFFHSLCFSFNTRVLNLRCSHGAFLLRFLMNICLLPSSFSFSCSSEHCFSHLPVDQKKKNTVFHDKKEFLYYPVMSTSMNCPTPLEVIKNSLPFTISFQPLHIFGSMILVSA